MFLSHGLRRKSEEVIENNSDEFKINPLRGKSEKGNPIEPFFISRIAGWFAFGVIIAAVTAVWCLSTGWQHEKSLIVMGAILLVIVKLRVDRQSAKW